MKTRTLIALAALAAAPLAAPLHAADVAGPQDWWMVYDAGSPYQSQFVSVNTIRDTDIGQIAQTTTVWDHGKVQQANTRFNCFQARAQTAVEAFLCGSERYRQEHGREIGAASPGKLAALYSPSALAAGG